MAPWKFFFLKELLTFLKIYKKKIEGNTQKQQVNNVHKPPIRHVHLHHVPPKSPKNAPFSTFTREWADSPPSLLFRFMISSSQFQNPPHSHSREYGPVLPEVHRRLRRRRDRRVPGREIPVVLIFLILLPFPFVEVKRVTGRIVLERTLLHVIRAASPPVEAADEGLPFGSRHDLRPLSQLPPPPAPPVRLALRGPHPLPARGSISRRRRRRVGS